MWRKIPVSEQKAWREVSLPKLLGGQTTIKENIKAIKEIFDKKIDFLNQTFEKIDQTSIHSGLTRKALSDYRVP